MLESSNLQSLQYSSLKTTKMASKMILIQYVEFLNHQMCQIFDTKSVWKHKHPLRSYLLLTALTDRLFVEKADQLHIITV